MEWMRDPDARRDFLIWSTIITVIFGVLLMLVLIWFKYEGPTYEVERLGGKDCVVFQHDNPRVECPTQ